MLLPIGVGILVYSLFLYFFIRFLAMMHRKDRIVLWRRESQVI
jgi:hypothetical protein